MSKPQGIHTLEEGVLLLQQRAHTQPLSVLEVMHILSDQGRLLILILLALPFCQPLQIPGSSIPFGLAIAFIGFRMFLGKRMWLPKKLSSKILTSKTLKTIATRLLTIIRTIKPWIHSRLPGLCHRMRKTHGLMICILGLFLALPLPVPFSNVTASWAILFISLGTVEKDGLFILFGYASLLLTIALFVITLLTTHHIFLTL